MLFIAAVNKMLDQIDDLFRVKLKLGALDSLTIIERQLVSPLLTAEYEETENKRASVEEKPIADLEQTDYPLRFVGVNWLEFLALSDENFKKSMTDNLSGLGLDTKKLLILFRLRKNIEIATTDAKQKLAARDKPIDKTLESKEEAVTDKQSKKKKKNSGEKEAEKEESPLLPSIEAALLVSILMQIDQAILCVNLARGLSGTDLTGNITFHGGVGETEILLQKMHYFLKEYMHFCTEVDKLTSREIGSPYAFRDMLPSVMLRDDFVIKCHLAMHEYILKNLDEYTQVSVDQKRSISFKSLYTQACNQFYYPDVSVLKRNQVIDFLVTLFEKTRDKDPTSTEYQKATLSCIDTYLSTAHTANQSNLGGLSFNFNKKAPKLEIAYSQLHESLIAKLPKQSGEGFHKCQASKLLRNA